MGQAICSVSLWLGTGDFLVRIEAAMFCGNAVSFGYIVYGLGEWWATFQLVVGLFSAMKASISCDGQYSRI
jgi:hypothetical protein